MMMTDSPNTSVFFEKDDERIVIWTNGTDRWTVTDMRAHLTHRYSKELAMALAASLVNEGYKSTTYR